MVQVPGTWRCAAAMAAVRSPSSAATMLLLRSRSAWTHRAQASFTSELAVPECARCRFLFHSQHRQHDLVPCCRASLLPSATVSPVGIALTCPIRAISMQA